MKLGYFTMPFHPPEKALTESLKEDREAAILADRLGFHEAFFGEHVTDPCEPVPSCLTFIASIAYETKQMRLGSGTLNLPNGHPASMAAVVSMIDHMLEGRFVLGISFGTLATDFEVFETLDRDRQAMFIEAIGHMLAIWDGEPPYDLKGEFWNISTSRTMDSSINLGKIGKPYQTPHPEIVCTALAPYSNGLIEAAKRGWHPVSSNFLQPKFVKSHWGKYLEGCTEANLTADWRDWRVARMVFVNNDHETAMKYGKSPEGPYGYCMKQILYKLKAASKLATVKESLDQPDKEITLDYCMDRLMIAGTVESVTEQILDFREQTGAFGTLLYVGVDWQEPSLARRSMELMAEEVMPAVNLALSR